MGVTIGQVLQQAIEVPNLDKIQGVEDLYCSILQAKPKHSDTKHNLGVLAVSLNKSKLALPLFKKVFKANPSQWQFRSSCIDMLTKATQFNAFKYAIAQKRNGGWARKKVGSLDKQLRPFNLDLNSISLPQKQNSIFTPQRKKVLR